MNIEVASATRPTFTAYRVSHPEVRLLAFDQPLVFIKLPRMEQGPSTHYSRGLMREGAAARARG